MVSVGGWLGGVGGGGGGGGGEGGGGGRQRTDIQGGLIYGTIRGQMPGTW